MITEWARRWARRFIEPVAGFLGRLGVTPNMLTVIGYLLNIGVAVILARGQFFWGGVLVLVAGLFDALDGSLARTMGRSSRFGAFLDSTLDRFSEATVYLGLLIYYTRQGAREETVLIYATIVGSLMVSYARARAEGIGVECKVGLLTRLERVGLLVIGLVINQVRWTLWILAIFTNFTALQRMWHVWRSTDGQPRGEIGPVSGGDGADEHPPRSETKG